MNLFAKNVQPLTIFVKRSVLDDVWQDLEYVFVFTKALGVCLISKMTGSMYHYFLGMGVLSISHENIVIQRKYYGYEKIWLYAKQLLSSIEKIHLLTKMQMKFEIKLKIKF